MTASQHTVPIPIGFGGRDPDRWARRVASLKWRLGIASPLRTEARRALERRILPWFAVEEGMGAILFVGCDVYTWHYARRFRHKEYWTIEVDPSRARYGARRHITARLADIHRYIPAGHLDAVICNGVFGWGLDARDEVDESFGRCHDVLRAGGVFMLGWNDIPERRPFPPETCASLHLFRRFTFPMIGADRYVAAGPTRHTFDFYIK